MICLASPSDPCNSHSHPSILPTKTLPCWPYRNGFLVHCSLQSRPQSSHTYSGLCSLLLSTDPYSLPIPDLLNYSISTAHPACPSCTFEVRRSYCSTVTNTLHRCSEPSSFRLYCKKGKTPNSKTGPTAAGSGVRPQICCS